MSSPASPPLRISPYLFYRDVEAAARFLEKAFGFEVLFTSPDPKGGWAHAQLRHGESVVMLGHAGGGGLGLVKGASELPALHAGVYVFVADVDAHCERARAAGFKVLIEPGDQPWGDRMYCGSDPEG
jgi:uncharacterized glyoxalase superfamily protein PhnB